MAVKASSKVFVFNPIGEVLVVQRSIHDTHRAGMYDLPGGGLRHNEDPAVGAVRETFEETGLAVDKNALEYVGFSSAKSKYGHSNARFFYLAHIAHARPTFTLDPSEVQSAEWRHLAEAVSMLGHEIQQYMGGVLMQALSPHNERVPLQQRAIIPHQRLASALA